MQIKYLEWDSNLFGYSVGFIQIEDKFSIDINKLIENAKNYKLVYIFSKENLSMNNPKIKLVDTKVTLKRNTNIDYIFGSNNNVKKFLSENYNNLLELTLQSGTYSRFNIDDNFRNNEYEKLYEIWIKNSVLKVIAQEVLVYEKNEINFGFTTLGVKNNIADIGLVAVNKEHRGMGVGFALILETIALARLLDYEIIQVVTQFENKPAIKLYEKAGFIISNMINIYHYWNI